MIPPLFEIINLKNKNSLDPIKNGLKIVLDFNEFLICTIHMLVETTGNKPFYTKPPKCFKCYNLPIVCCIFDLIYTTE